MLKILLLIIALTPQELKREGIIVYFLDPHCPYCRQETYLMRYLTQKGYNVIGIVNSPKEANILKDIGFPVKVNEGEAEFAEVQSVPTIGILLPKRKEFYIISEGYISYREFWNRVKEIKTGG